MSDVHANHLWALLDRVKTLMEDRNHVIHGSWTQTAPGGPDQLHDVVLGRRGFKTPIKQFSPRQLKRIAREMEEVSLAIHEDVLDIFEGDFLDWDDETRSPGVRQFPRKLPLE
jgi:hypothetical protein